MNDLIPSKLFLKHFKNFAPFKSRLLELYNNYPNKDKITVLFDYWVFNILALKETYGQDGLLNFCDSNSYNPQRFSFLYEFQNFRIGTPLQFNKSNYIKFFLLNYFINKLFIPGATLNGIASKILNRISGHYIHSIPIKENSVLKYEVLKIIDEIMTPHFSIFEIDKVKSKLPTIFYSEIVSAPHGQNILVKGSCASFLEFSGIERLFLLDRKLKIEGFQHGGGYDVFKIDYFAEYEKQLSDIFFGWGFSLHNRNQPKYKKLKKPKKIESVDSRVLWIEGAAIPSFYFFSMPYHHFQHINKKTKSYIYNELNESSIKYSSLYHPSSKSDLYANFRKDDYFLAGRGPSENLIGPKDILIFDNSDSSLIHFAIENNIIFFNIIGRNDFNRFTPLQKKFFLMLRKNNLGFYSDEKGKLHKSILAIIADKKYSLSVELLDFNKTVFKSNQY